MTFTLILQLVGRHCDQQRGGEHHDHHCRGNGAADGLVDLIELGLGGDVAAAGNDLNDGIVREDGAQGEQRGNQNAREHVGHDDPEEGVQPAGPKQLRRLQDLADVDGIEVVADAPVHIGQNTDAVNAHQHHQPVGEEDALTGIQTQHGNGQDHAPEGEGDHADALDHRVQGGDIEHHHIHGHDDDQNGDENGDNADNKAADDGLPEHRLFRDQLVPVFQRPAAGQHPHPAGGEGIDQRGHDGGQQKECHHDQYQIVGPKTAFHCCSPPFATLRFI